MDMSFGTAAVTIARRQVARPDPSADRCIITHEPLPSPTMIGGPRWWWTAAMLPAALACAPPCVDDGLHANQRDCPASTTDATESDSGSDGDSESQSSEPSTGEASCSDDQQNGDETAVDCGGSCSPCADFSPCLDADDCLSNACHPRGLCVPPGCVDGLFSPGGETHVDCGLSCGRTCDLGAQCLSDGDCFAGMCVAAGVCALHPTCADGSLGADESDLDCGAMCGPTCDGGQACASDDDCRSLDCDGSVCTTQPQCTDKQRNGGETDVDCGGPCPGCGDGMGCIGSLDCSGGSMCVSFMCI
jgi:hypothetical protein